MKPTQLTLLLSGIHVRFLFLALMIHKKSSHLIVGFDFRVNCLRCLLDAWEAYKASTLMLRRFIVLMADIRSFPKQGPWHGAVDST